MGGRSGSPRQVALVLIGAVSWGAFEAGALEVLALRDVAVRRIVGSSSGALNGVAYAAGVRARREVEAAAELSDAWRRDGHLRNVIRPSLRAILGRRGLSDQTKLLSLLRRHVRPCTIADPAPVELAIVVAPIRGVPSTTDGAPATTFSRILSFPGRSFDEAEALERVFVAVTASAAFPLLYAPVDVPGIGPCLDGGFVNIAPVLAAFGDDGGASLDAIVVIAPTPAVIDVPEKEYRGLRSVAHLIEMIFVEWLYQDLRRVREHNDTLERMYAAAARHGWSPAEVELALAALGLRRARPVPIVSIRPAARLPGSVFAGLEDARTRETYIELGRARATEILDALGW